MTTNKATPTITNLPTASSIAYGQTLASSTLDRRHGLGTGHFHLDNKHNNPERRHGKLSVTFTPTNTTDYNTATGNVSVTTNKATPTITNRLWPLQSTMGRRWLRRLSPAA